MKALLLAALLAAPAGAAPPAADPPPAWITGVRAPSDDELALDYLWEETVSLPADKRPRTGLALSGGAARGYAHVGVITALTRAGFPIDVVAGTSMGAVLGFAYASGMPLDRMRRLASHLDVRAESGLASTRLIGLLLTDRLVSSKAVERYLDRTVGDVRFDELKKPFACVATDIKTGEKIVFREGPVAPAVRASMNLPGIFAPVEYRHRFLVDGGVVDFLPVDIAREMGADWVLASVTEGDYTLSTFPNVLFTLEQVIDISGNILSKRSQARSNVTIAPEVGDIKIYEFDRAEEAVEKGLLAGRRSLASAKRSLALATLPWLLRRWAGGPDGR